tara:strand:- start:4470 stop:9182 length:4713 start_codon:yes stop_codon:yes gene_type:complete
MKSVEKNTFYKSTTITRGIAVKPNFSDLAWGGTDTLITLKGGADPTYYAVSGNVAATPKYGESELIGGYMQLYTSGVTMPNIPSIPQLELYKTKQGTTLEEGTMRLSYTSGTVAVANETGQDISVYRSGITGDNVYMQEHFDGGDQTLGNVKIIQSLGNGTAELSQAYLDKQDALDNAISLGGLGGGRKEKALESFFMFSLQRCHIEPEGDYTGVWRSQTDKRKGNAKALWRRPYWKWDDIKKKVKFAQKTPVASDIEASVQASKGNTIFDEVHASASLNNPFTSDQNNPLMMTTCELSTAKKYSGGQSFRMYHLWDYSTTSANLQLAMGARGINPSTTRASIYNLPQPPMGFDAADQVSDDVGWNMKAVPTIDMRMNITKLGFTPYLRMKKTAAANGYPNGTAYYDGTPQATWTGTPLTASDDSSTFTSMLRSVTVTFSNYKPKSDHTTLDKFLAYGLKRFYSNKTSEQIVGGVTFMKAGIDSAFVGSDPATVYASAIPVAPYMDARANTTLKSYGLSEFTCGSGQPGLQDTLNVGASGWLPGGNASVVTSKIVQIPLDSWFNAKFVIDAWAPNTTKSAQDDLYSAYTTTALEEAGVPMRCYFETEISEADTTDSTGLESNPYVDIYFPAVSGAAAYNFSDPAKYPKHMTVWVQNYRWVSGSNTQDYDNSFGIFEFGDNNGGYPNGAAIEAELFIDDIKLTNFTPDVENVSAGASIRNQQYFTFRDEAIVTPFTRYTAGTGVNLTSIRAWAASGASESGSMNDTTMDENLVMGFEDTYQLPNSATATGYDTNAFGYILCNGFSTATFDSLNRVIPYTATVSVSGNSNNQKYLGGQFFGNHYIRVADENTNWDNTSLSGATINVHNDSSTTNGGKVTGSISMMTGTTSTIPSQDGFSTKGLFRFGMSGSGFDADDTWTRRENVLVSTKITQVPGMAAKDDIKLSDNQIRVANPQVFNKHLDESYIIYKMGYVTPTQTTGSANTCGWGEKGVVGVRELKLSTETAISAGANIITFDQDIVAADHGGGSLTTEDNITELWVGPKKYWLNLRWPSSQTSRTYQNFCIVQNVDASGVGNIEPTAAAMSGATWRESQYSYDTAQRANIGRSGLYLRGWELGVDEETTLDLGYDYGYGVFEPEEQTGGQVATANAKLDDYVYLDLMGLARNKAVEQGEPIVFRLGIEESAGPQTVSIHSDEATDALKRPKMYWQYKDKLPIFKQPLTVEPNFNILSGSGADKVDLYKLDRENLNAVRFRWAEEGDDVVYRLLYIDSQPIEDKYHKILFHAPMNEIPTVSAGSISATGSYYTSGTSLATAFSGLSLRQITGSAGWAFNGTGTNAGPSTATNWVSPWFGKTKATFIAHCVPNCTSASNLAPTIFSDYYSSHGSVTMGVNKTGGPNVDVIPFITLVKGTGGFSGNEVTVTSDYSFRNDGESPLFIVATFDATLAKNNIKLYVNGRLVKQSGTTWTTDGAIYNGSGYSAAAQFRIGKKDVAAASVWWGTMEEIIVHDDVLYVPTEPNEYLLTTESLPDRVSNADVDYTARLFLFDYHNIIGTATDEVASSNTVRWGATGI